MPPSTTMARISADSMKVKDSGLTMPWRAAKNAPPRPANIAPSVNAESLIFIGCRPRERLAISSSRSASQARPMGMRISRLEIHSVTSASVSAIRYSAITMCSDWNSMPKNWWKVVPPSVLGLRVSSRPNTVGLGMPEMPSGPPVKRVRLISSSRMISPKPSVTMAR
ncbi:hypothetical protein D3C71_1696150 [compost metagenome]